VLRCTAPPYLPPQPHNPQTSLSKLLLFYNLTAEIQGKIVAEMYERSVRAGEILIQQGDTGLAASELYVVKSGSFEVRGGGRAVPVCRWSAAGACKRGWQRQPACWPPAPQLPAP
jgi:hypothetical protein